MTEAPTQPDVDLVDLDRFGIPTLQAEIVEGYESLGVERILLELPTEPRDETLRFLDEMASAFTKFA